ncbi:MAG TPA: VOC family protein [Actinomycetota bacterium]|nr:VOC family protein [Actinomycetota bacterium]
MPDERACAILKTADVARTIEWYREVGFELRGVHPETGEPTWCELARDGVVLQFLGGQTPWPDPPGFTGTLYFFLEAWRLSRRRSRTGSSQPGDLRSVSGGPGSSGCAIPTGTS